MVTTTIQEKQQQVEQVINQNSNFSSINKDLLPEFCIKVSTLDKVFTTIKESIAKKVFHPILNYVLVQVNKEDITFTTFDLSTAIQLTVDDNIDVYKMGSVCLPYEIIAKTIKTIKTTVEAVNFTVTDNEAEGILYDINDVDKKFNLMVECLSSEDYPSIEDTVEQSVIDIEMDSTILLKGLDAIKDSVSTEDSKPYLQGINLKPDLIDNPIYNGQSNGTGNIDNNNSTTNTNLLVPSNHIKLASTNASILKFLYCEVVNHNYTTNDSVYPSIIIPTVGIKQMISAIDYYDTNTRGNISIKANSAVLKATIGNTTVFTRLIDAMYPKYEQLIPTKDCSDTTIYAIDKEYLLKALNNISVTLDQANRIIRLTVNRSYDILSTINLNITTYSKQRLSKNTASSNMPISIISSSNKVQEMCDNQQEQLWTILLNIDLLESIIRSLPSDVVIVYVKDNILQPVIFNNGISIESSGNKEPSINDNVYDILTGFCMPVGDR